MEIIRDIFDPILSVVYFLVVAHFIMSWLIRFEVLNIRQEIVGQVWHVLQSILEPIYRPIRNLVARFLPNMGGIDISPIFVLLIIIILRNLLH